MALVLLGVLPVLIALGTTIVPRQCGANTLLFPRAAALSCWTWLIGAGMTVVGFLVSALRATFHRYQYLTCFTVYLTCFGVVFMESNGPAQA